jgi:hypothetical protein
VAKTALKLRDAITTIASGLIDRERPKPRVAEVFSYNRFTRVAEVLLTGETEANSAIQARFPKHLQPTKAKMDDGIGNAIGDLVLVEGTVNNYRITQIVEGDATGFGWSLGDTTLLGGELLNRKFARYFSRDLKLPALGSSIELGRFYWLDKFPDNSGRALVAYVDLVVQSVRSQAATKVYRFHIDYTTVTPTWQNLFPIEESGVRGSNEFSLEIYVPDEFSFRLRVRNNRQNATNEKSGYACSMWLFGEDFYYDATTWNAEDAGVSPGVMFGNGDVDPSEETAGWNVNQGPYFMPQARTVHGRTWENLTGGGTITWSDKYVKWSNNLVASIGRSNLISNGVIQVGPPVVGQSIYYHGFTGVSAPIAYTASGVDMLPVAATHSVLYYEPDYATADGANGKYHVVGNDLAFKVPSHWMMIAVMNQTWDYLKLGTGHSIKPWQKVVGGEKVDIYLRGIQSALVSLATSGSFQTITNWTEQDSDATWCPYSAGVWTMNVGGKYDIKFMTTTASNATGGRAVRINRNNGTIVAQIQSKAVDLSLATGAYVAKDIQLSAGDTIRLDAMQNSGGALNTVPGENFTYYSIKRVGP